MASDAHENTSSKEGICIKPTSKPRRIYTVKQISTQFSFSFVLFPLWKQVKQKQDFFFSSGECLCKRFNNFTNLKFTLQ